MAKLSDAVAVANVQVQRLASELGELMPVMAEQTADLKARAEQFAGAATDQMKELERHVDSMRSDVTATAAASDDPGQGHRRPHAALSHLQFQDVAAQRVLHVDNWLHDVEVELRDGDATGVTPRSTSRRAAATPTTARPAWSSCSEPGQGARSWPRP
ncbi:MAG: hypothetical protein IPL61_23155 [Myxococcales bacterium]|nr:hypothetical protein [Myxococcales bacterium]